MLRLPQAVVTTPDRRFPIPAAFPTRSRISAFLGRTWEGLHAPTPTARSSPLWAARSRALCAGERKRADPQNNLSRRVLACLTLTFLLPFAPAHAAESSEPAPLAAQSLLLDVTRAGPRLVAVGDRGHVLLSDDEGVTWRQIIVPTRAMLTGVAFGDATHGWAVGHDGVILHTADAGLTWTQQPSGQDLETVLLDVAFADAQHGFVVGAYGKCLVTTDGGRIWTSYSPSAEEMHLNQIARSPDGTLYLAGEMGTLLTARNPAGPWTILDAPYDGSLHGLLPLDASRLLVYGLRGRVFASDDAGATWSPRETKVPVLLMAGVSLKAGPIVLAGLGGNFNISRDAGATFTPWQPLTYTGGVSALLEATDGALVVVGEKGVARLTLP
ncbi:Ycf48-like protein precursor [Lacunisphaera limnophila]|uniref:Ycf48-like protein n=1 Tax=Lacunisphaera limnophila TaxID=1838286 RepID=A0A1D8AYQ2_9BACT|nr:YCF48-related protein [Lacunisphaera limnophila]AOS46018.1 Ycf48-like protein precursor [Lacunisphaera limnophila]